MRSSSEIATDLALADVDQKTIAAVKQAGVPLVTVLISGRPLILGRALEASDAIVAAWLPGTEGDGVADVLFGRSRADRQAAVHVAAIDGPDPDQRRRPEI